MSGEPVEYAHPASLRAETLQGALEKLGRVERTELAAVRRAFLDTFDWRLFYGERVLEAQRGAAGARLVWRCLRGQILRRVPRPAPRFVWDLPEGSLREELQPFVEMRALAAVAWVRTGGEMLAVVDDDGKVRCRLYLQHHHAGVPGRRKPTGLTPRVRVEPVRGYDGVAAGVGEVLAGLALEPLHDDVLEEALAELGVTPSEHSTKVRVDLAPQLSAAEAARRILVRLLRTLEENEAGARAGVDSEFLHDFRVAVRRTRSALGQLGAVLPAATVKRFRDEFAWLGRVTTPTRDLDVHLLDLPRYRRGLPQEVRTDLDPLRAFLQSRQRREQAALARALDSRRYRRLRRDWREFLDAPPEVLADAPAGALPIGAVAEQRLRRMFRRALDQGQALADPSAPQEFHELRKTCKKLRYLLEFFQSLYPEQTVRELIETLKGLQDNLGEFQDLQVQSAALRTWALTIEKEGLAGGRTQLAIGMLVEKLLTRQREVRRQFARAFAAFAGRADRERFESLFAASPAEQEQTAP